MYCVEIGSTREKRRETKAPALLEKGISLKLMGQRKTQKTKARRCQGSQQYRVINCSLLCASSCYQQLAF